VALGRSRFTVLVAVLLVVPALVFLTLSETTGDTEYRMWSWRFSIGVLVATLVPLLRYVLGPEILTLDRLLGGVAAYLMLGLLWCYFYALAEHRSPGSLEDLPSGPAHVADMVFLSYGTLTTGGLADIVPRGKMVHALVILEELTGTLFMAVVVARLVSSYPRRGAQS
jgi:Ion channel